MLSNSSTASKPASSTLTDKRESQPYNGLETEQTRKLNLLRLSCEILITLIVIAAINSVVGVLFEGRTLTYTPIFLVIGVIGTFWALMLAKPATFVQASWMLIGTFVFILASIYLVIGTNTPVMVFFLLPMFLTALLLDTRSVIIVSGFCVVFSTGLYIFQNILDAYTPPQSTVLSEATNISTGLFITLVLLPALVVLVGTSLRAQARALQAQHVYLQRTLDQPNLRPQTGEMASQQAGTVVQVSAFGRQSVQGSDTVQQTIQVSQEVGAIYQELLGTLNDLNTKNSNMQLIMQILTSVAPQTRLLALNATIEAAGYDSQFAGVAQEVRELALRLSVTNQQIASIIAQIQRTSQTAIQPSNQNY